MRDSPFDPSTRKPLRLWPGVLIVALQWLGRFVVPLLGFENGVLFAVMAGMLGGPLVLVWWLFFSRAPWLERIAGVFLMLAALFLTPGIAHVSIATGAQGMLYPMYAIPTLSLGFVVWAAASRNLPDRQRYATMAAAAFLSCGIWALVRTNGVTGGFDWDFAWRWSQTAEERLLARVADDGGAMAARPAPVTPETGDTGAGWPGFRGPRRDGVVRGVRVETDWSAAPPVELWRREVGPGWSSFAVRGDLLYTQEQRGEEEVVAAYRVTSGEPVWMHRDPARFWEAMAGPGPRGTPTLAGDRLYAFGATGILNALNPADGAVIWSRNAAEDAEMPNPGWGFAASPLVIGDMVVVAASGRLAAYDAADGELRWLGPPGNNSYGSPQLFTIDGVAQILLLNGNGLIAVSPQDGTLLWEHAWGGFHSLQPALTADGDVLMATANDVGGNGIRRLDVTQGAGGWTVEELWATRGLKPYFNDLVVHDGHAFGFDGRIMSCIDLATGERVWKGGRYGNGQVVMLADQDVMLVISEDGELALVEASTESFNELARFRVLEGKTWNHPVLVGDVLLVRNDHEMAAFRLTLEES